MILENRKIYSEISRLYDYRNVDGDWYSKVKNGTKWNKVSLHESFILNEKVSNLSFNSVLDLQKYINNNCKSKLTGKVKFHRPNLILKPDNIIGNKTKKAAKLCIGDSADELLTGKSTTGKDNTNVKRRISKDTLVSDSTNINFINKLDSSKINTSGSVPIFKAGQDQCAKFVNDFSNKISAVGDAWIAHDTNSLGDLVYSAFSNLSKDNINKIIDTWLKIDSNGGGIQNGPYLSTVRDIVNSLVPKKPPVELKLDDIVGIFYPPSSYHEKAFYDAGKIYFVDRGGSQVSTRKVSCKQTKEPQKCSQSTLDLQVKYNDTCTKLPKKLVEDGQGGFRTFEAMKLCKTKSTKVAGKTINSGKGWGMNTHVGIVGAIKNGVPIIFHNIHGQVYADAPTSLKDGGRIAWVRRPAGPSVFKRAWEWITNLFEEYELNEQPMMSGYRYANYKDNTNTKNYLQIKNNSSTTNLSKSLSCVPKEYRYSINNLIKKNYDKKILKYALGVIGRESSYGSGLRYDILNPLKNIANYFGVGTSVGPAQMKSVTAKQLNIKGDINNVTVALDAVYKFLKTSYETAKQNGYSTNKPSSNFANGTGDAAMDIAIASYNMGKNKITKYCETNNSSIKRSCSLAGQLVEQKPDHLMPFQPDNSMFKPKPTPSTVKKYKVTNKQVLNYLPNFKTTRWDGVNISTHGYVKEVADKAKTFTCF